MIPSEVVDRLVAGENPIKVWRKYRNLTLNELAGQVGITQPYLSQIEGGKREGKIGLLRKIETTLNVDLDALV
ncbi:MAG: helix-turn-helix transcriptional regulator, partial [Pseudomonadota bacterium]|nr:helix-turn-helix transcriptional regulator [Pseudomonadota bacterium]